jgi:starch synthase
MGRDWGERAALEAQAHRLGVAHGILWLDHVADPRAYRDVIRRALALVLPSEWEAFGLVLLDALAAGTPVVATAVGAVPEVLEGGRAGRLVPYGDVAALAAAIRAVRGDAETSRALVAAGRMRVQGLDWSVAAEKHRALYRELVGR